MSFEIRKAASQDVPLIYELLKQFGNEGLMLPRSLSELYDVVRAFHVAYPKDRPDSLAGVCAVHVCWEDLGEIRSLAVASEFRTAGLGAKLLEKCYADARDLGIIRLFVLTYIPDYFKHQGYSLIDRAKLPHKIWADCIKCINFPECGEIAMEKLL